MPANKTRVIVKGTAASKSVRINSATSDTTALTARVTALEKKFAGISVVRVTGSSSGMTFSDGTHTVTGATELDVTGGTIGGTSPTATLTIAAAGFSITDGSHTVLGVTSLSVTGGTVGGTSPSATLTIAGGGGGSALVPATIGGLVIWFDASILAAPAGALIPVVGSPDQSRSPLVGFSLQGGGAVSATALNGKPVLTMNGTAGQAYTINSGPRYALGTACTIFAVVKGSSFAGSPIVVSGPSGSLAFFIGTSGALQLNNAGVAGIASSTGTLTVGVWKQFNASYLASSGAYAFRIASTADSSGTSSGNPTNVVTTLFDFDGGGEVMTGDVAEVIAYNRVLTLTEKQAVEAYLLAKWGV